MVENDVYICPPTPERVEQCSRTPPPTANARIRDFLKAQQLSDDGDSSNNEDGAQRGDGANSPPNCAICLGKISSKCFTDSCMHQFCFSCLLEWSKIKAECPLCKQTFKSIIHNVTSMDKYDEYKVEPFSNWITNQLEQYILAFPRYRTNEHPQNNRIYQLFLQETPLTERFAREFAVDNIPPRSSGSLWRAYVYQRNLYALPLLDFTGRSRDISARFYRENPAQIHRLMPWLNREIIWLLSATVHYINVVLHTLEDLIATYDMTSVAFRRRIQHYFHRYTSHFIHELTNFARSPYDLVGYDRNVQYRPYFEDEIQSIDSSDESPQHLSNTDSDSSSAPFVENRFSIQAQINNSSFIVFSSFGGNAGSSNSGNSSSATGLNGGGESSRNISRTLDRLNAEPSLPSRPIESVNIESDDSDECLFVGEQKPPHLRTPEMVELNSETDSDVMFVDEEIQTQTHEASQNGDNLSGGNGNGGSGGGGSGGGGQSNKQNDSKYQSGSSKRKRKLDPESSDESWAPSHEYSSSNSRSSSNTTTIKSESGTNRNAVASPQPSTSSSSMGRGLAHLQPKDELTGSVSKSPSISSKCSADAIANTTTTTATTTKKYAYPKRRLSHRKRSYKSIYESSSSSASSSELDENCSSSSSSSESSHEEYQVGRPSCSSSSNGNNSNRRKGTNRSKSSRRKSSHKKSDRSSHKKKRKLKKSSMSSSSTSSSSVSSSSSSQQQNKQKHKLSKLCIKKEKNANYRLIVKCLVPTSNESSRSSASKFDRQSSDEE